MAKSSSRLKHQKSNKKTQILNEILWYLKYSGFRRDLYKSFTYKTVIYITLFFNSWYIVTTFWRLVINYKNIEIVTETVPTITTGVLALFKIFVLYYKRNKLIKLLNDIQSNVDKCKYNRL